jgi:Response regulators consisting of a CheY-like receiver domain and a winged-helix DNA-binding domain
MSEKPKILVVDDELQIMRVMRHILSAHQYSIRTSDDAEAAFEMFHDWQPDLVITDLQLPGPDGLELCKRLRSESNIPIIILSVRNEETMIVAALDAGADDYVTKPFGTNELLARIRSLLRRVPERNGTAVEAGEFFVDAAAHKATIRGKEIRLTPKEFELLDCLVRNPDKVLTHTFLLQKVWGNYYAEQPEALRVLVGSLRKKIESDPANPRYLLTEPWIGYRFISSPESL